MKGWLLPNFWTICTIINDLVSDDQYHFRSGRSTANHFLLTYEYVSDKLDEKSTVDLIFFALEKAFVTVNNYSLFSMLLDFDIESNVLVWTIQYLTNRKIIVRGAGKVSTVKEVISGIPQETCSSQLFFFF